MAIVSDSAPNFPKTSIISPDLLAYELAIRGHGWMALRRVMSVNTVTKLRAGARVDEVHPSTLLKLDEWLRTTPVRPALKAIFQRPLVEGDSESAS
jgi:hypothetical protein